VRRIKRALRSKTVNGAKKMEVETFIKMRGGNFQKQESVPKIRNFYIEPTNI
jgi:hypothetical protein